MRSQKTGCSIGKNAPQAAGKARKKGADRCAECFPNRKTPSPTDFLTTETSPCKRAALQATVFHRVKKSINCASPRLFSFCCFLCITAQVQYSTGEGTVSSGAAVPCGKYAQPRCSASTAGGRPRVKGRPVSSRSSRASLTSGMEGAAMERLRAPSCT